MGDFYRFPEVPVTFFGASDTSFMSHGSHYEHTVSFTSSLTWLPRPQMKAIPSYSFTSFVRIFDTSSLVPEFSTRLQDTVSKYSGQCLATSSLGSYRCLMPLTVAVLLS